MARQNHVGNVPIGHHGVSINVAIQDSGEDSGSATVTVELKVKRSMILNLLHIIYSVFERCISTLNC